MIILHSRNVNCIQFKCSDFSSCALHTAAQFVDEVDPYRLEIELPEIFFTRQVGDVFVQHLYCTISCSSFQS